jgi:hypothetical protein
MAKKCLGWLLILILLPTFVWASGFSDPQNEWEFGNGYGPVTVFHQWTLTTSNSNANIELQQAVSTVYPGETYAGAVTSTSSLASDNITMTYSVPSTVTVSVPNYLQIYVNSSVSLAFHFIVTDTSGNAVTLTAQIISPGCASLSSTSADIWDTVFVTLTSAQTILNNISTVQISTSMGSNSLSSSPIYLDNLITTSQNPAAACNTPTPTPTPVLTAIPTPTGTIFTPTYTPTGSITPTPTPTIFITPTPTATATPMCPISVYPNPMNFQAGPNSFPPGPYVNHCPNDPYGCIKFDCVPFGSTLKIYTISLELVQTFGPNSIIPMGNGNGRIIWDGDNSNQDPVAAGIYFYLITNPLGHWTGKFAIEQARPN